jgi:hypothetical protein
MKPRVIGEPFLALRGAQLETQASLLLQMAKFNSVLQLSRPNA